MVGLCIERKSESSNEFNIFILWLFLTGLVLCIPIYEIEDLSNSAHKSLPTRPDDPHTRTNISTCIEMLLLDRFLILYFLYNICCAFLFNKGNDFNILKIRVF